MASNAPNTCEICENRFNEENRCPRMLPCSHCICQECVGQLIDRNQKSCPFCRQIFQANSAKDLGVNRYLLDVLKYVEELEKSYRLPVKEKRKSVKSIAKEFREDNQEINAMNISECLKNKSNITNKLEKNTGIFGELSQLRFDLKTNVVSKLNEVEAKIDGLMRRIGVENTNLKVKLKEVTDQENRLKSLDKELFEASSNLKDAVSIMEETELANERMQQLLKDWDEFLTKQDSIQHEIEKVVEKTANQISIIQEVLNANEEQAGNEIERLAPPLAVMTIQGQEPQQKITADSLRNMNSTMRRMIEDDRVFVVHPFNGKQRYARITHTREDCKIYIHHLQEVEHLHSNAILIPFSEIRNLVNLSSHCVFLDLGIGGEGRKGSHSSIGRIIIKLVNPNQSNLSLNFSILCTGNRGPTFVGSNILGVAKKNLEDEWLWMGDYEHKYGGGGKAVVPDVNWSNEFDKNVHISYSWIKGLVWANYREEVRASVFSISTRDIPRYSRRINGVFGRVEKGQNILSSAARLYPDITLVKVVDCGTVLSIQKKRELKY